MNKMNRDYRDSFLTDFLRRDCPPTLLIGFYVLHGAETLPSLWSTLCQHLWNWEDHIGQFHQSYLTRFLSRHAQVASLELNYKLAQLSPNKAFGSWLYLPLGLAIMVDQRTKLPCSETFLLSWSLGFFTQFILMLLSCFLRELIGSERFPCVFPWDHLAKSSGAEIAISCC